ncbi:MAG: glycine betaine/L-proline ABC transporter ATP-binding protein [Dehalococcoidia bacterium]|nr:glycine betaine/L-proline ABC transporter ATP-binding protein [Dehalococcoidia bacterium]
MSEPEHQIEVDGLWKVFGSKPERALEPEHEPKSRAEIQEELGLVVGLRDVSFAVDPGEIFVVMGLSGSGKSTLVRCLIRLIEATKGQVRFDGEDILTYSPEQMMEFRRSKVAMVFQHYALLPHRQVLDNVAYGLEIRGMDKADRYEEASKAIETVGLKGWEDYYPSEMSGGMQQRVGLARALAVNPEVLLMDEPFSGLDPLIRREMQDELVSLQSELRKTIVFITHDLNEALKLGDRIAIMRDGEIIQEGSPEEIVTLPSDEYVTEFVRDVSRGKVIQAKAIMREPDVVVHEWQGPRAALHIMDDHGIDEVFLIARDATLRGILTEEQMDALASQQVRTLEGVEVTPALTTSPETYIEDIIPIAAQSRHPVAVVADNGSLLGEIRRGALLSGMSSSE